MISYRIRSDSVQSGTGIRLTMPVRLLTVCGQIDAQLRTMDIINRIYEPERQKFKRKSLNNNWLVKGGWINVEWEGNHNIFPNQASDNLNSYFLKKESFVWKYIVMSLSLNICVFSVKLRVQLKSCHIILLCMLFNFIGLCIINFNY